MTYSFFSFFIQLISNSLSFPSFHSFLGTHFICFLFGLFIPHLFLPLLFPCSLFISSPIPVFPFLTTQLIFSLTFLPFLSTQSIHLLSIRPLHRITFSFPSVSTQLIHSLTFPFPAILCLFHSLLRLSPPISSPPGPPRPVSSSPHQRVGQTDSVQGH